MSPGRRRSTTGPRNVLAEVPPDGLPTAVWKHHTKDKLYILGYYLEEFTGSMQRHFRNLVFLDLFAGSGRGRFGEGRGMRVMEGSPLIAARTRPEFTKLVFVEKSPRKRAALEGRLNREFPQRQRRVIPGDCNDVIEEVRRELPTTGLLAFCFIDPFGLQIHLSTIARLHDLRIDFLILIADQMAGARDRTLQQPNDRRIERFLGDPEWHTKWAGAQRQKVLFRDFLLQEFTKRMREMRFLVGEPHRVRVTGERAFLYRLAFFSKKQRAIEFWDNARRNAPRQRGLELG